MKMNYVQKIVLLILLIGTSFFIGYTFGHGYVGIESVESYVLSILGVLAEVVVLFRLDRAGYDLEEKKQRNFDSDHELFQEIIGFLPESLMAYFSSACPEICINNASISTLCEFEEIYQGKVLKTFHDKRMKKKYDALFSSVKKYISFTSTHLFPTPMTSNLSLRQSSSNGIEFHKKEFDKLVEQYDEACNEMIFKYREFIAEGKKVFG